jgi:hypothetical protein
LIPKPQQRGGLGTVGLSSLEKTLIDNVAFTVRFGSLKPFRQLTAEGRILNNRLYTTWRVIEYVFVVIAARFRNF